ncbi:MAG: glycosyltransferase [Desulfovibrio sp.]|jgi:tRNA A37 methylthiotransferase MiaB/glycosyltransferase involved in cell wall biosynthesis/SAM-dependent methyltransferase|nr:glycosyltransferase [Desulfovibrio sp.]
MSSLSFTGERIVPEADNCEPNFAEKMRQEHICRYYFAAQFVKGKRVLDVGCGVGYGSRLMADEGAARVVAFDIDQDAIAHAGQFYAHEKVMFACASAFDFDFGEGCFDVVTCFELIEHVEQQDKVLRMIKRACAPDGLLVISTPRPLEKKRAAFHVRELHIDAFLGLIKTQFPYHRLFFENNHFSSLVTDSSPPPTLAPVYMRKQFTADQADYFICLASLSPLEPGRINSALVVNDDKYVLLLEHDVAALRSVETTLTALLKERDAEIDEHKMTIAELISPLHKSYLQMKFYALRRRGKQFFMTLKAEGLCPALRKTKNVILRRCHYQGKANNAPQARLFSPAADLVFVSGCGGPSQRYRVENIAAGLQELGFHADVLAGNEIDLLRGCRPLPRAVVFFRCADVNDVLYSPVVEFLTKNGVNVFCDYDDLVFEPDIVDRIDAVNRLTPGQRQEYRQGVEAYRQLAQRFSRGTASTRFLAARLESLLAPGCARVIPNSLNRAQLILADRLWRQNPAETPSGRLNIVYASGTRTHQKDFEECAPALARFLREYPNARFILIGHLDLPPAFGEFEERIRAKPFLPYLDLLAETAKADINLAPLEKHPFNDAKSELKIFEAGIVGVPTIASPADSYAACIEDGVDGLLAATEEDWYKALCRLADDADFRQSLGRKAREKAAARFSYTTAARIAAETYGLLPAAGTAGASPAHRHAPPETYDPARLDIAWVLPNLMPNSGGHRNILRAAHHLSLFGHRVALYIMNTDQSAQKLSEDIKSHYYPFTGAVTPYNGVIAACDALFATHWSTVETVMRHADSAAERMYFVQDFEPYFVPMSSEFIKAENTYRQGFYHICSGPWCERFLKRDYSAEADSFLFPVDRTVYHPRERVKDNKNIVFFAKPEMMRRCYELGLETLQAFHKLRPDVEILFFGSRNVDARRISFPVTTCSTLPTLDDLAALYANADLGLVFSTTNPSLVPYEMMACGLPVVDLDRGDNHYNYGERRDIALLADPRPETMARQMAGLLDDKKELARRRANGLEFVNTFPTEEEMARRVESLITRRFKKYSSGEKVSLVEAGVCGRRGLDLSKLTSYLRENGFNVSSDDGGGDILLFWGCAFNQSNEEASLKKLYSMESRYKKIFIMEGLAMTVPVESLRPRLSTEPIIIKMHEMEKLDEYFYRTVRWSESKEKNDSVFTPASDRTTWYIQTCRGCLDNCSYCGDKKVVGQLRSKPLRAVMEECRRGLAEGYAAIRLIGDDVGAYGLDAGSSVFDLLDAVTLLPGLQSLEIEEINIKYLIKDRTRLRDICRRGKFKFFCLAFQHVSDEILARMNRGYTRKEMEELLDILHEADVCIRFHAIIGFPGETPHQLDALLCFIIDKKLHAGDIFIYQKRAYTPAANFDGHFSRGAIKEKIDTVVHRLEKAGYDVGHHYLNDERLPDKICIERKK